jgi:anaerobic ribonucleoside-triphosphate reductase
MQVIKRDGRTEAFDFDRIIEAIDKASARTNEEPDIDFLVGVVEDIMDMRFCWKDSTITVQEIHEIVEDVLMRHAPEVAREYIKHRQERDIAREGSSKLLKDIEAFIDQSSEEYLRENANKSAGVVSTHRDLLAGIMSKHFALTQILPKDVVEAHVKGAIHVHDNDYCLSPLTNCLLVNYEDMLENGFKIGDASIEKPKSIGTACTILTQIAQAVSSSTYGGQSHAHIDSGLKQYAVMTYSKYWDEARKYSLPFTWVTESTKKAVYDAMQSLLYQVNTLTTSNGQSPFITISLGLDTDYFGRMITEQYLKVHMKGIGKEEATPVFPKVVFFLQEGVNMNPGDPNYDLKQLAIECSSKRIYPDYIAVPKNKEISGVESIPVTPMGCRSFLSAWQDGKGNEKLNGRFNLGVVSLNLPYIAQEALRDDRGLYNVLDEYAELCYKAHMSRIDRLKGTKASQNPIMWMEGACARLGSEQTIDHLFYDGYASISLGFVGLYECIDMAYNGMFDNYNPRHKQNAIHLVKWLKQKCEQFTRRSGIAFSLYGTPSESLCYKAANAVKKEFGEDKLQHDFLTNSFHYPVWKKCHPMEKWEYEKGFAEIVSGGNISYVETPNLTKNLKAYEGLLDYAYHLGLHYFAINCPVDKCYECHFEGEFKANIDGYVCPECGNDDAAKLNVLRRVSGYISAPNSRPFNRGKQREVMERVKHYHNGLPC